MQLVKPSTDGTPGSRRRPRNRRQRRSMNKTRLANAKRLVVKVGSALVTNNGAGLDLAAIDDWARQISVLRQQGKEVVLVSSGAIACGMQRLGCKASENRP